jgi:threonine dehydrogenase-like Zn-dependent dehydrogenase
MQGLTLSNGELQLRDDLPRPTAGPEEAVVRVTLAGVCSTDLELVRGYHDFNGVLGHEFVGVVEGCADEKWLGKRVVGTINFGCRQCAECRANGPEHCTQRTVLGIINQDGIFAEYAMLPIANLLEVPDSVSDEAAVFTEPLAAALRVKEQVLVHPDSRIAVVGPGRLGLLIGQVLALSGANVTMFGRRQGSMEFAHSLGLAAAPVEDGEDNGFDVAVEATGNEAGLGHAMRLVRPQGTLVMKSTYAGAPTVDMSSLVVDEVTLVGSRCGPFAPALRLLDQGQVSVLPMIEGEYPLREGISALEHAARPGVLKILIRP